MTYLTTGRWRKYQESQERKVRSCLARPEIWHHMSRSDQIRLAWCNFLLYTSVGAMKGQRIIRVVVVVVTFSFFGKIFRLSYSLAESFCVEILDPEVVLGQYLTPMTCQVETEWECRIPTIYKLTLQLTNECVIYLYLFLAGLDVKTVFMKIYTSLSSRKGAFEYRFKQLNQTCLVNAGTSDRFYPC